MVTTAHSALDDRILYRESASLAKSGYEVTILAPLNDRGSLYDMAGKSLGTRETKVGDVRIIGYEMGEIGNAIQRFMMLATVGGLRLGHDTFSRLVALASELKADVYHCHEIWSLYASLQIKKRLERIGTTTKLIYDVHEYTPAVISSSSSLFGLYQKIMRGVSVRFEREALRQVDYAITANQITRGYLLTLDRFTRTEVIYNCPTLRNLEAVHREMASTNKVMICHEGSLGFDRGLRAMTEVLRSLRQTYGERVELLIIGDVFGPEKDFLNKKIAEYGLHNAIRRTGWLPYERVESAISQGDIGIIFMEPTENNMLAGPPNKLFNYMKLGLAVVSVDLPETTRIVMETKCGMIVRERDSANLARTLSLLVEDERKRKELGENGKRAVRDRYNWERMEGKLLRVYEEVTYAGNKAGAGQ